MSPAEPELRAMTAADWPAVRAIYAEVHKKNNTSHRTVY
jgi:hypothetical protein